MNQFGWWLADLVSRTLEPDEREVVRGDLAESGETGGRALLDVFGLAIRRQSALWMNWRPWLALVGLVLPLGVLLCLISRREADGSAIYLWLYSNYWEPRFLTNPTLRHDLSCARARFWPDISRCFVGPGAAVSCSDLCLAGDSRS